MAEIDIAPLNMIKHSSCGTDEELDTSFQFTDLRLNRNSTVNCQTSELIWWMLQILKSVRHLDSKLPSGCKYDGLYIPWTKKSFASKELYRWQSKGESLSWTGKVSGDYIFPFEDGVKAFLLNWEKSFDPFCDQVFASLIRKLGVGGESCLRTSLDCRVLSVSWLIKIFHVWPDTVVNVLKISLATYKWKLAVELIICESERGIPTLMTCITMVCSLGGCSILVSWKVRVGRGSLSRSTDAWLGVVLVVASHLQVWSRFGKFVN